MYQTSTIYLKYNKTLNHNHWITIVYNDFLFIAIYLMIDLYLIVFSLFYTPEAWVIFLALFPQLLHFYM